MQEVYYAAYEHDGTRWHSRVAPSVARPDDVLPPPGEDWVGVGNGFAAYPALGRHLAGTLGSCDAAILPTIVAIGSLALPRFAIGEGVPARDAAPVYVRHRVALTSAERAAGMRL
jgi:tRNA threonylcarbamoyladenosine biosynthesis protein TsaB